MKEPGPAPAFLPAGLLLRVVVTFVTFPSVSLTVPQKRLPNGKLEKCVTCLQAGRGRGGGTWTIYGQVDAGKSTFAMTLKLPNIYYLINAGTESEHQPLCGPWPLAGQLELKKPQRRKRMKKFCVKGLKGLGAPKMMFELFSQHFLCLCALFLQRLTEPFVR